MGLYLSDEDQQSGGQVKDKPKSSVSSAAIRKLYFCFILCYSRKASNNENLLFNSREFISCQYQGCISK